ncbi:MAG TPA: hypothetical protein VLT36_15740 [Candidatus Dormibacteraeota bacterium]|nr:hypothetical protein [Candidatus Dormibacteraeota bacterium]
MAKVKLSLQTLSPDQKVAFGTTVITSMTGNPNFVTPNPTLASATTVKNTLQTAINDYNAALAAAQVKLAAREAAEVAFNATFTLLGAYVDNVSGGDRTKAESSGMSVRADVAPVGPLTQVLNLVLTAGDNEGTLDAAWDSTRGANSYEAQTSADPVSGTSWVFKTVASKSSITLDGLTTGNRVWARVRAIGANNSKGPWSDPAVKTVP